MIETSSKGRAASVLVALITLAVFLPGLGAGFLWDDHLLVLENQLTDSLVNLPRMFSMSLWETSDKPHSVGYFRPLVLVDFALDRAVAGLNPIVHHAHSLLWHLCAVGLVFALLRRLVDDPVAAAGGAALFAVHPVQVEPVMFISARNDPMAAVFLLSALLVLDGARPQRRHLVLGGALVLAAALCKESVLLAPVLLGLYSWARGRRFGPVSSHVAVLSGLGAYGVLRGVAGVGWPAQADAAHLSSAFMSALAHFAQKLLWPIDLAPVVHLAWPPPVSFWAAGLAVIGGVVLVVLGGRRAAGGLAFAIATWLPTVVAVAHTGMVVDRYMYLPMAGLAWAVAASLAHRLPAFPVAALIGVGLAILAGRQVPVWRGDAALWSAAIDRCPSGYVHGAYAKWLDDEGRLDEAAMQYERAVTIAPRPFEESCFNITDIHKRRGDPHAAVRAGRLARESGCPSSPELLAPYALMLAYTGDWDTAARVADEIHDDPTGLAIVVRVAAAARMGDLAPLGSAEHDPTSIDRDPLRGQVVWLLEESGEAEAAAAVRMPQ